MVRVPPGGMRQYDEVVDSCSAGVAVKPHSRQIGHGQRWVTIKMVGFNEPLKQVPTHLGRFIEARREVGGRMGAQTSTGVASNGQMGRPQGSGRKLPARLAPHFKVHSGTVTLTPPPR
ncbi:hypothetical protein OPT61_g132 [Boeremia exigua]|uniref:Uncharacterized protein n=1 Tax=Boeremia exigua TaxID=749465 RepID=A0ACC2IV19_9PLEO|nr:hypothetical protein OPT61_g132 [Boeremia exigua]